MVYPRAVKVSVLKKVLPPNNENIVYLRFREIEHAHDWMADFVNWPERWGSQKTKVWKAAERVVLNKDKTI